MIISSLCDLLIITQLNHLNVTGVCVGLEVSPSILISPSIKDSWVSKDQFVVSNPVISNTDHLQIESIEKEKKNEKGKHVDLKFQILMSPDYLPGQ